MEWLFLIVAQIGPDDYAAPAVCGLSLGFAVWFGWYTTTKTLPDKDKFHFEQEQALLVRFDGIIKDLRDECRQERTAYLASIGRMNDSIDRLETALSQYGFGPQS